MRPSSLSAITSTSSTSTEPPCAATPAGTPNARLFDGSSLRGRAGSFARVLKRVATEGWWDNGLKSPLIALGPGSGKVQGHRIRDTETLAVFRAALEYTEK